MLSHSATTSTAVGFSTAPALTKSRHSESISFQTGTWWPALRRFLAMIAWHMSPRPRKPNLKVRWAHLLQPLRYFLHLGVRGCHRQVEVVLVIGQAARPRSVALQGCCRLINVLLSFCRCRVRPVAFWRSSLTWFYQRQVFCPLGVFITRRGVLGSVVDSHG